MATSPRKPTYDIFLVHSTDDSAKATQINEALKAHGYSTWAHYKEGNQFDVGRAIFDNIIRAVEVSKTVLILVTENSLKSEWVTFEMVMAFEKSHREQFLCIRLVFEGVTDEERKAFMTRDLELIPYVCLNFNKDNWIQELVQKIEEQVSMVDLLPAGNVAVGLVYNYFVGYLKIILPVLQGTIETSEYSKGNKMFSRFLLLIPNSCKIPRLEGQHGDYEIKKEGSLNIEASHGDKKRSYNPAVYSIWYKGSEPYFFVGECPFILETMHKINANKFSDIDLHFQVNRFRLTLLELVNHRHNKECHETVHLMQYDDSEGFPVGEIWKALDADMKQEPSSQDKQVMNKAGTMEASGKGDSEWEYFSTITNIDAENDKTTADSIITFLKSKNVNFTNGDGGKSEFTSLDKANFNVFVLSGEAVRDAMYLKQYDSALQRAVSMNQIKVVGVMTRGTSLLELPQNMRWITLLKEEETDYLDKMWAAMQSKKTMTESIPVGKVYEGLAYAYLLNYLSLAVTGTTAEGKGFHQRFEDAMVKYGGGCRCVPRVFIIVPKSCSFPDPGSRFVGEEHLGELEPVVMGFRKYFLQLYRLTLSTGEKVCYAREYATPAITLHEMANTIPFSGLTKEAMYEQAEKFAEMVTSVIRNEEFKSHFQNLNSMVSMVYFDDEHTGEEGMKTALEPILLQCLEAKDFIAFE